MVRDNNRQNITVDRKIRRVMTLDITDLFLLHVTLMIVIGTVWYTFWFYAATYKN